MNKDVPQPPEDKKYAKEDILGATTVGDALHAYRQLLSEAKNYETSGLQKAVADKAHELGDEQTSKEFTLLMTQTENNERFLRGVEVMADLQEHNRTTMNIFEENVTRFDRSSGRVRESAEAISGSLDRRMSEFSSAAGVVDTASRTIKDAATSMSSSASVIDRASHR